MSQRPFGEENREKLLDEYFAPISLTPHNAWEHVYRLLLWIDRTTGLAHCYESDKCRPGRPWYGRTLAFHEWLSREFGVGPDELGESLDWMFQRVLEEVRQQLEAEAARRAPRAREQRGRYSPNMPTPGADPRAIRLVVEQLDGWLEGFPPADTLGDLQLELWREFAQENKRKNLLGEGFEDTLAHILRDLFPSEGWHVAVRERLDRLPGFSEGRRGEKPRKVDLAVVVPSGEFQSGRKRTLVTSKWSVRADREEQFAIDYNDYARLERWAEDFDYVLVTNEFDPARLWAACERRTTNASLFDAVVHVNPEGLRAAYSADEGRQTSSKRSEVINYIDQGRIVSLATWLRSLGAS